MDVCVCGVPELFYPERFLHLFGHVLFGRKRDSNANFNSFLDEDGEDDFFFLRRLLSERKYSKTKKGDFRTSSQRKTISQQNKTKKTQKRTPKK